MVRFYFVISIITSSSLSLLGDIYKIWPWPPQSPQPPRGWSLLNEVLLVMDIVLIFWKIEQQMRRRKVSVSSTNPMFFPANYWFVKRLGIGKPAKKLFHKSFMKRVSFQLPICAYNFFWKGNLKAACNRLKARYVYQICFLLSEMTNNLVHGFILLQLTT